MRRPHCGFHDPSRRWSCGDGGRRVLPRRQPPRSQPQRRLLRGASSLLQRCLFKLNYFLSHSHIDCIFFFTLPLGRRNKQNRDAHCQHRPCGRLFHARGRNSNTRSTTTAPVACCVFCTRRETTSGTAMSANWQRWLAHSPSSANPVPQVTVRAVVGATYESARRASYYCWGVIPSPCGGEFSRPSTRRAVKKNRRRHRWRRPQARVAASQCPELPVWSVGCRMGVRRSRAGDRPARVLLRRQHSGQRERPAAQTEETFRARGLPAEAASPPASPSATWPSSACLLSAVPTAAASRTRS